MALSSSGRTDGSQPSNGSPILPGATKMIPYIVFDHVVIGPMTFYTWGFFVGLAFAAGYFLTLYRAKRKNIPPEKIFWLALAIFFGAALGSRAAYLLQFPREWLSDVSLLWRFYQGGLMLWGGILGAMLFGWLYIRKAKLIFWQMADLITPAIALGIGIGRIGCFLINDHLGAPTNLPWGILWPDGISRHPVALYESLVGFALFAVFWLIQRRLSRRAPQLRGAPDTNSVIPAAEPGSRILDSRFRGNDIPGQLFLLFLASYSIIRFILDFLRASQGVFSDPRWWGLTSSQWISVVVVIFCFVLYNKKRSYNN